MGSIESSDATQKELKEFIACAHHAAAWAARACDATQKELKATAPNAGAVAAAGLGVTDAAQKELKGFSIERVRVVVQAQQLRKN